MEVWKPLLSEASGPVVLVTVLYLLVTGWLFTRAAMERERDRTKRAEDQVDQLVPAVEKLTTVIERFLDDQARDHDAREGRVERRERGPRGSMD